MTIVHQGTSSSTHQQTLLRVIRTADLTEQQADYFFSRVDALDNLPEAALRDKASQRLLRKVRQAEQCNCPATPAMQLLPAPRVAGLLPASVSSTVPPVYQYDDHRLPSLDSAAREQLFLAADKLLHTAVSCLVDRTHPVNLDVAGFEFVRTMKSLLPAPAETQMPAAPSRSPIPLRRYRSREEMDAELQTLLGEMVENVAAVRRQCEVRHG